jgi:hypothetical protein
MSASFELWQKLPPELLRKKSSGFSRLDYGLQQLVVVLAEKQKFKCALCDQDHSLVIEHDHEPKYGIGDCATVYNTRGLACQGCNRQIHLFEMELRGEYSNFPNVYVWLSDGKYWNYIYAYECRANPLIEAALKADLGELNYWRRWNLLYKYDRWKENWNDEFPWPWGFEEIKDKRYGTIRTPKRFIEVLTACVNFVAAEYKKDPNYRPPDNVVRFMFEAKTLLDKMRPDLEARLKELGHRMDATGATQI